MTAEQAARPRWWLQVRHAFSERFTLDLDIRADAPVLGLQGPPRQGASALLRAVAGAFAPWGGHIEVAGRVLFDRERGVNLSAAQRGAAHLRPAPQLRPLETVRSGLSALRPASPRLDIAKIVDALGLAALLDATVGTLPDAALRRVAVASVLAREPAVLLLDEPLAGVGLEFQDAVVEAIASAREALDASMLVVCHRDAAMRRWTETTLRIVGGRVCT
ncbi:MAG: ATP-binding cassette domain-containing protein [Myxococcota bacterium]